ncbi:MAG TPA: ParB/RepB/Spo0J family partition protein [Acetobacteraceae bacterium]|nr:ParB/RepB/Spo0J family partition protein [Acetobacteraceae bacterium]
MTAREPSPRLGRGLAALLGETSQAVRNAGEGVRALPLDLLEPGPFQPRGAMDEAALGELADSIRSRGILQPLLARAHPKQPGRFQIIAGERRWRAAAMAGLHEAPVLVRDFADLDALAVALVENLQRQDLSALEEAEGYHRLIEEFGLTQEQLATAVGKSRAHISNMLRLLNLPGSIKSALRAGTVTAGHARALLSHPAPEQALGTVIANGLSVRATEALAAEQRKPAPLPRPRDPDMLAIQRELSGLLGLRIEIGGSYERGVVRIAYANPDQLEGILAKLRCA